MIRHIVVAMLAVAAACGGFADPSFAQDCVGHTNNPTLPQPQCQLSHYKWPKTSCCQTTAIEQSAEKTYQWNAVPVNYRTGVRLMLQNGQALRATAVTATAFDVMWSCVGAGTCGGMQHVTSSEGSTNITNNRSFRGDGVFQFGIFLYQLDPAADQGILGDPSSSSPVVHTCQVPNGKTITPGNRCEFDNRLDIFVNVNDVATPAGSSTGAITNDNWDYAYADNVGRNGKDGRDGFNLLIQILSP